VSKYYSAFGLMIKSDLKIDEFVETGKCDNIDVRIRLGKVPVTMNFFREETSWYQAKENELIFSAPNVARYYIRYGNEIIIESLIEGISSATKVYLLGTAFGAILLQRGRIPLHGSGLSLNDIGIIVTGESGAGKSTIANALIGKGHMMVTDDVAALELDSEQRLKMYPSYPKQKLWQDSAKQMKIDVTKLKKIDGINDKYYVSIEKFCNKPTNLSAIFELKSTRCNHVIVEELTGREQLEVILNNTYRPMFIEPFGLIKKHFFQCVAMTKMVKVYRMYRPENEFTIEEQVKTIECLLNNLGGKQCNS